MDMKDFLNQIMPFDIKRPKEKTVGKIDDSIRKEYIKYNKASDRLKDDMSLRAKQLDIEFQRKMDEEFEERIEEMKQLQHDLWNKIEVQLNLEHDQNYSIDTATGEIKQVIEGDEEEDSSSMTLN